MTAPAQGCGTSDEDPIDSLSPWKSTLERECKMTGARMLHRANLFFLMQTSAQGERWIRSGLERWIVLLCLFGKRVFNVSQDRVKSVLLWHAAN